MGGTPSASTVKNILFQSTRAKEYRIESVSERRFARVRHGYVRWSR